MKIRSVNVFPNWLHYLLSSFFLHTCIQVGNGFHSTDFHTWENSNQMGKVLPVIYDSSSIDGQLQTELAKSIFLLTKTRDSGNLKPLFVDLKLHSMDQCATSLTSNRFKVVISLLGGESLHDFVNSYDQTVEGLEKGNGGKLFIYTPRSYSSLWKAPHSVVIKSLQMSEEARAVALLNRVSKVGVKTLIPIVDGDSATELELLKSYYKIGSEKKLKIKFTKPIQLTHTAHGDHLKTILQEHVGFREDRLRVHTNNSLTKGSHKRDELKPGILLLARNASNLAMKIATQKKHLLLNWFSPNILEFEEWAYKQSAMSANNEDSQEINRTTDVEGVQGSAELSQSPSETLPNNNFFGLYTVNFVGSKGWDNPIRRQILRELAASSDASPKILLAVLTFDAVTVATDDLSNTLKLPLNGLSGEIEFSKAGFRKSGSYLGLSLVPKAVTANATLLQPSTWILEDIVSLKGKESQNAPEIRDYDVATSSILTKDDLLQLANSTTHRVKCSEHLMKVVVHDPFTQMPYNYFFTPENLPEAIVVPNHQGFGITFSCTHFPTRSSNKHDDSTTEKQDSLSTVRLACTPGLRLSQPINCFRSYIATRQKRDATEKTNAVPNVQYSYSFSNNDPWLSQNYYQPQSIGNRDYQVESATYGQPGADRDGSGPDPAPPPPPPPPPAPKLPDLRQVLKAAKPFVGSCIGSTTGCAMCVLVLGRLPLGTAPPACTGPCFVGTFGSCGSLLGRVFSETTVICTELYKQGLLDVETFIADAEFGKFMTDASPYTMEGYKLLATPLVEQMKSSKVMTNIVATFAIPWAHHMKYILGRSNDTNLIGSIVHLIGYPLCNLSGRAYHIYTNFKIVYFPSLILFLLNLVPYLLTILLILILSPNLRRITSTPIYKRILNVCTWTIRSKQLLQNGVNYFKAIGRRT